MACTNVQTLDHPGFRQQLSVAQFQPRLLTLLPMQEGEQIPVNRFDIVITPVAHNKLGQTHGKTATPTDNGNLQLMQNPGQAGLRPLR